MSVRLTRRNRRKYAPAPEPVLGGETGFDQAAMRQRRRQWLRVSYGSSFDLAAEIRDITTHLAGEASQLKYPLAMRADVDNVTDAVHELLSTVVGMLAGSAQLDRGATARIAQAVADLAQRPREPVVDDNMIVSGSWAALLVEHVEPHSADLARFLGRATKDTTDRFTDALRILDAAAMNMSRKLPKVAARQALPTLEEINQRTRERQDAERAERALAKITNRMGAPAR